MYTFTEDYYEDLNDGRGRKLLFKAGATIAWDTARELGLVTTKHPPKADEPKKAKP